MYTPLNIDFEIPEILQNSRDEYINNLNHQNGNLEDCYRAEIRNILNGCDLCLNTHQINLLRDYYQKGGIYNANTTD